MPGDVYYSLCGIVDFDIAAHFYGAGSDYECGNAGDYPVLSDTCIAVQDYGRRQSVVEVCGIVLCSHGRFRAVLCHAQTWRSGLDAAVNVELSLLFQEFDQADSGGVTGIVFRFYLHRNVFWGMGSGSAGCCVLFGTKGGDGQAAL